MNTPCESTKAYTTHLNITYYVFFVKHCVFFGAEGRTRTGTDKSPKDFKSFASTYSATPAFQSTLSPFFWFVIMTTTQFCWRRHPGSNRGMEDLQSSALPLGYAAAFLRYENPIASSYGLIHQYLLYLYLPFDQAQVFPLLFLNIPSYMDLQLVGLFDTILPYLLHTPRRV